jgi:nucleotide-binding universal stress UspA family protein
MGSTIPAHRKPKAATRGAPPVARPPDGGPAGPIVAGVDGTASGQAAAQTAVAWAKRLGAPIVFAFVRRPPMAMLGEPYRGRRVEAETLKGQRALSGALAAADAAGVDATAEILDGRPARRLIELARSRGARLLITGPRTRRLRPSVPRRVLSTADRPVLVAAA